MAMAMTGLSAPVKRDGWLIAAVIVLLLGTACCFRLMRLSSVPGISGDEGFWGVQALAWLQGRPYVTHTTSGNPIDLVFLIPIAWLHAVWPPSFRLLRAVPALANLLALPIGFWFVRRAFDEKTAWIFTVALACLPTAIAHSRICQDPSQTVFWTGLVIYCALVGLAEPDRAWTWLAIALALFPVALWTHPTNVFIAPFLLLPAAPLAKRILPASRGARLALLVASLAVAVMILAGASFVLNHAGGSEQHLNKPWLAEAAHRMISPSEWFELAANTGRLFNGVTIYHYFSGARPWTVPYDLAFVIVTVLAIWGMVRRRTALDRGLLLACGGTWLAFFAFAGPGALRPHFERWGLCLLVPGTLVLAAGAAAWMESPRTRRPAMAATALVTASLLVTFYINYFREFATTGGRSHLTYITAPVEPKAQALQQILSASPGPADVAVVAQQWWLVWPMAYLATGHTNVSVTTDLAAAERAPGFADTVHRGRLFLVEFAGTPELADRRALVQARGWKSTTTMIGDAAGRDLVAVLQVTETTP